MTAPDPFQVIEEALSGLRYSNEQPNLGKAWQAKDALAALAALREERERLERDLRACNDGRGKDATEWERRVQEQFDARQPLITRAEKAEAERDECDERLTELERQRTEAAHAQIAAEAERDEVQRERDLLKAGWVRYGEAENQRLREALREIEVCRPTGTWRQIVEQMQAIARRALGEGS